MDRTVQLASERPLMPTTISTLFLQPALWERIRSALNSPNVIVEVSMSAESAAFDMFRFRSVIVKITAM